MIIPEINPGWKMDGWIDGGVTKDEEQDATTILSCEIN